jgi:hypothetical protein
MRATRTVKFEDQLADILTKANIPFKREVALGGHVYDFAVQTSARTIYVEAKSWEAVKDKHRWAKRYVEILSEAAKGQQVFVVIRGLDRPELEKGVTNEEQLVEVLRAAILHDIGSSQVRRTASSGTALKLGVPLKTSKIIFAAMPFAHEYYDVYALAMEPAAEKVGAVCVRVDEEEFEEDIPTEIRRLIRLSIAVVADLSDSKPDVLYEVGYARAFNRKTVQICSTGLDDLPMTVRNRNTIRYSRTEIHKLKQKLERRLKKVLETK